MTAVVLHHPGPPSALQIEQRPIPIPRNGELLMRVKAFGLNRSELFTRLGQSPNVKLPRILGIEATGLVAECPGGEFSKDEVVVTCMGGLGREVDGGYAEYTLIKAEYARSVKTSLPWDVLGALPEMLQTSWGALNRNLKIEAGERLLIRGGTTSVGLAAAAIGKSQGLTVLSTTRRKDREQLLRQHGVDHVIVDTGSIVDRVTDLYEHGVDAALELVGSALPDTAQCVRLGGRICQVGVLGGMPKSMGIEYEFYGGEQEDFHAMPLQKLIDMVVDGSLPIQIGKVFNIEQIEEAHDTMEQNKAGGKIVVLT